MFVATDLCGVAPFFHGVDLFGISQITRKALPYTLAKTGYLLCGTLFYAVTLLRFLTIGQAISSVVAMG